MIEPDREAGSSPAPDRVLSPVERALAEKDWAATSVGSPNLWSLRFKAALDLCLKSRFPMIVYWGPELLQFFNDAYLSLYGARGLRDLGRSARHVCPEIWREIGPMISDVLTTGKATWSEDMLLTVERDGALDERYFTFSLSPVYDERGIGGVVNIVSETTANVLQARSANESVVALTEFRKLTEHISDIVWIHAPDGVVEWANERWATFTGLPLEVAMRPAGWAQVIEPEDYIRYVDVLQRAVVERAPYELELRLKPAAASADGYRWYFARAKPMFDDRGVLLRWAGMASDIHDRREAEATARLMLERERDREHRASSAFQDAALPKFLPSIPGLTFSAVYEAAKAEALVGGDWYDAFMLSDGRIVLSVGDVMGSGLAAAVTMNAVRQSIRGAAQIYPDPASVLDAADRALRSEQPDGIVTAFVAVLDTRLATLSYASAGHPAPLLRLPDGTVCELSAPDLPLGLRARSHKVSVTEKWVDVVPGSLLVLYTDGLVEATRDIEEGDRRLRAALALAPTFEPDKAAQRIRDEVLTSSNDDVAILTLTFGEPPEEAADASTDIRTRWTFPIADATAAASVRREVISVLMRLGLTEREGIDAEFVVGELLGNVLRHAADDAHVILDLDGESPVLHVLDNGPGFAFETVLPSDAMSESGRGLFIVSTLTKGFSVTPRPEGGSHARAVLPRTRPRR